MNLEEIRAKFPQYEGVSDGDLLMGIHRKYYPNMHPREFLNGIEGAANAHATIKNPELRKHWVSGVSHPMQGENEAATAERLSGTSYGPVNEGGRFGAGARSTLQGMTYGYGDELVGQGAALLSGNAPQFEVNRERMRLAQGEEKYPGQSLAAEIGGAFALPGAAMRKASHAIGAGTLGGMMYAGGKSKPGSRLADAMAAAPASFLTSALAVPLQRGAAKVAQRVKYGPKTRPSLGLLKSNERAAYKAVDDSGFKFTKEQYDKMLSRVYSQLDDPHGSYVGGDSMTERARRMLEKSWGEDMTLTQLDNVRKRLWASWRSAKPVEEPAILNMIQAVDEMIEGAGATPVIAAAREAHKVYMRTEFLEKAFQKAADRTGASGSGGNIYNNYQRVFVDILNNDTKARMFTPDQLAWMRKATETPLGERTMRKLGKLSPDGNGLMLALTTIGGSIDPTILFFSGGGMASKLAADSAAGARVDDILNIVSGGKPRPPITTPTQVPQGAAIGALRLDQEN